jgi:GDPmannose 4,6-dehydratase
VREFVEKAFACVDRSIEWRGSGIDEKGVEVCSGKVLIEVDFRYFRPTEVDLLVGDPPKAQKRLGWRWRLRGALDLQTSLRPTASRLVIAAVAWRIDD